MGKEVDVGLREVKLQWVACKPARSNPGLMEGKGRHLAGPDLSSRFLL